MCDTSAGPTFEQRARREEAEVAENSEEEEKAET
jgi:hypothetical protein